MRKFSFLLILLAALRVTAQKDSVYIAEQKDDMTDKVYYFPSRQLLCVNPENKKQGFVVSFFMQKENTVKASELKTTVVGVGSCHEKDEVILLLEGDVKVKGTMWNDFNCDGKAWFKITQSDKELLAKNKVLKVRVQNGRSFESYTHVVEPENQDYFIQFFYAVDKQIIKPAKK